MRRSADLSGRSVNDPFSNLFSFQANPSSQLGGNAERVGDAHVPITSSPVFWTPDVW